MTGSLQLRLYRRARRDAVPRHEACTRSGVGIREAGFIDADDARDPPGEGAFAIPVTWARRAIGGLVDTPLGDAAVARWAA